MTQHTHPKLGRVVASGGEKEDKNINRISVISERKPNRVSVGVRRRVSLTLSDVSGVVRARGSSTFSGASFDTF